MSETLIALFSISYGTVGLVELLWTLGALAGMGVTFMAIWRSHRRSVSLRQVLDGYTRRWANRSILIRNGLLGLVLEVTLFVGIAAMFDPPNPVTASGAVAGLVLWLIEMAIIATVLYEEMVSQIIRHHLEDVYG